MLQTTIIAPAEVKIKLPAVAVHLSLPYLIMKRAHVFMKKINKNNSSMGKLVMKFQIGLPNKYLKYNLHIYNV